MVNFLRIIKKQVGRFMVDQSQQPVSSQDAIASSLRISEPKRNSSASSSSKPPYHCDFKRTLNLKGLLEHIHKKNHLPNDNNFANYDQIIDFIINTYKAKKHVGAGVGGLIVRENPQRVLEVLLVLRPKEPEKFKWAMIGGSIEFGQNARATLIERIKDVTGCKGINNNDLIPLRITNHTEKENNICLYHYISPSFIVYHHEDFIKNIDDKIDQAAKTYNTDDKKNDLIRKLISSEDEQLSSMLKQEIDSGNYFLQDWDSKLRSRYLNAEIKQYIVKWFDISQVTGQDKFAYPTIQAVQSYSKKRKQELHNILSRIIEIDD